MSIKQTESEFDGLINELTIQRVVMVKEKQKTTDLEALVRVLMSEKMEAYQERSKEVLIME